MSDEDKVEWIMILLFIIICYLLYDEKANVAEGIFY